MRARWVVNAAGLGADIIDGLFGHTRFTVTPRRGELIVYDKLARRLVEKIVLPVPTAIGKGVLVSPTIYGNVMLGPTADDIEDRTATGTTEAGFKFLLDKGRRLMPELLGEEVTATYAGLRAASTTATTSSTPIRSSVISWWAGSVPPPDRRHGHRRVRPRSTHFSRNDVDPKATLPGTPRMPNLGEAFPRPYQRADLIAQDPAYGRIVCFCERVTAGEIRDACHSTIPPTALEGLRRRTRVMNGRCQGFFCGAEVRRCSSRPPMTTTVDVAVVGGGPPD